MQVEVAVRHAELAARSRRAAHPHFPRQDPAGCYAQMRRVTTSPRVCVKWPSAHPPASASALETHGDFARGQSRGARSVEARRSSERRVLSGTSPIRWRPGDSIEEAAGKSVPISRMSICATHVTVKGQEHWLPVLAGVRQQSRLTAAVNALRGLKYDGYVSFEWEKYWHPEIEEPESRCRISLRP